MPSLSDKPMTPRRRQAAKTGRAADAPPIVPLLPYQRRMVESPARLTWNCWARQTGKSFAFALRRVTRGIQRNRNQVLLSAGERQSRELMDKVRLHLTAIKAACDATVEDLPDGVFEGTELGKLETRVRIPSAGVDFRIIALPANPMTARGYTGDLLLDEFAMHRDDAEIWSAVFPTVTRGNGEIDICSTPKGQKNMFYRLRRNAVFATSTVTIHDAIADGLKVDVETLKAGMADDVAFAQEFLCEFLDEATAFLTFEMIGACEDVKLDKSWSSDKAAALAGEDLFSGWDVGRHRDLSVFWVWGKPAGADVLYTRGVIEMPRTDFEMQHQTAAALLALPNMRRMAIDATGMGAAPAERIARQYGEHRVEQVTFVPLAKQEMATLLRLKCEDRTIRIPADPDIRNDWHSITRLVLPGGTIRYDADRGHGGTPGHADRFWAAALGIRAASVAAVPFEWHSAGRRIAAGEDWNGL